MNCKDLYVSSFTPNPNKYRFSPLEDSALYGYFMDQPNVCVNRTGFNWGMLSSSEEPDVPGSWVEI